MPKNMQVRAGADPRHSDDDVRFRSTLYLRVFSVCENAAGEQRLNRETRTAKMDSLYRFRMTGKASALGNEMHFESGTLRESEIARFGSAVPEFKPGTGESQNGDEELVSSISKLKERLGKLEDTVSQGDFTGSPEALAAIDTRIGTLEHQIAEFKSAAVTSGQFRARRKAVCDEGFKETDAFALLGPEGWKILKKDERLVLAMSSSAKPLISTLNELASLRVSKGGGASLEPLTEEEIKVLGILLWLEQTEVETVAKPSDVDDEEAGTETDTQPAENAESESRIDVVDEAIRLLRLEGGQP